MNAPHWFSPSHRRVRGFTLIEAALAIVIIGTAVLASMELLAVGTRTNKHSFQLTTGVNLSETVRERMHGLTFGEIIAEDGKIYTPPIDVRGTPIAELPEWSQVLNVTRVDPNRLTLETPTSTNPMARVAVEIQFKGRTVCNSEYLLVETE